MTYVILALMAAVATAFSHVLAKESLHRQDTSAFLIVRTGAATAVLAIIFIARNGFAELTATPPWLVWVLIGMGLFCPLAANVIYFAALKRLPVNIVTPVFHSYPAMAFVLGLIFLGIRFSPGNFLGVLAVVSGVAGMCLRGGGMEKHERTRVHGMVLCLIAAVFMAVSTILWKVLQTRVSALAICFVGTGAASVALLAVNAGRFRVIRWGRVTTNVKTALSGILVFGMANLLSIRAMKTLSPGVVYSIVSSSVLWVGVLAFFTLKEKWIALQIVGAVLVFVGVVVLGFGQ